MIVIDRTSSASVADQVEQQLRFLIATGRFEEGSMLPSTRTLGRQVGVSFHTIRKVYQSLASEGLLASQPGSGYSVVRRAPVGKEVRMERGAAIAADALMRMAAIGLSDADIAYLFEEQRALMDAREEVPKVVMAAPYVEIAERCADDLADRLQLDVLAMSLDELDRHPDADIIITPYPSVHYAMQRAIDADVVGVEIGLGSGLLDTVARLSRESTLGLLVADRNSVAPLVTSIRESTGFPGDVVAASIDNDTVELLRQLKGCEVVVVSPGLRRRIPATLRKEKRIITVDGRITEESLARVRAAIPR